MISIAEKRKTVTSYEVKKRWADKNYKRYAVSFRQEDDAEIIDFIEQNKEKYGTTELFRMAIETLKIEGLK